MSTQADHGHEPVPRPEQTPDALRSALAAVDPKRLPEMQRPTSRQLNVIHITSIESPLKFD